MSSYKNERSSRKALRSGSGLSAPQGYLWSGTSELSGRAASLKAGGPANLALWPDTGLLFFSIASASKYTRRKKDWGGQPPFGHPSDSVTVKTSLNLFHLLHFIFSCCCILKQTSNICLSILCTSVWSSKNMAVFLCNPNATKNLTKFAVIPWYHLREHISRKPHFRLCLPFLVSSRPWLTWSQ